MNGTSEETKMKGANGNRSGLFKSVPNKIIYLALMKSASANSSA